MVTWTSGEVVQVVKDGWIQYVIEVEPVGSGVGLSR